MNTNPDEAKLALWLDDELTGADLAAFEPWALSQPEHVQAREEIRQWRAMVASTIPASEEPPYPEFFNNRVLQAIREQAPVPIAAGKVIPFWKSWLLPTAACAGMALTFWLGTKSAKPTTEYVVDGAPRAIPVDQFVYTPETGVKADVFSSGQASTVIVLNGVRAIPDTLDFSETTSIPLDRNIDSTAGIESETDSTVTP